MELVTVLVLVAVVEVAVVDGVLDDDVELAAVELVRLVPSIEVTRPPEVVGGPGIGSGTSIEVDTRGTVSAAVVIEGAASASGGEPLHPDTMPVPSGASPSATAAERTKAAGLIMAR
ncbi:MAG: hypothetical protein GY773_24985 [Actinomycetia bacterium]|nr:hypothetical protein [Actinomycetes bacterium]